MYSIILGIKFNTIEYVKKADSKRESIAALSCTRLSQVMLQTVRGLQRCLGENCGQMVAV